MLNIRQTLAAKLVTTVATIRSQLPQKLIFIRMDGSGISNNKTKQYPNPGAKFGTILEDTPYRKKVSDGHDEIYTLHKVPRSLPIWSCAEHIVRPNIYESFDRFALGFLFDPICLQFKAPKQAPDHRVLVRVPVRTITPEAEICGGYRTANSLLKNGIMVIRDNSTIRDALNGLDDGMEMLDKDTGTSKQFLTGDGLQKILDAVADAILPHLQSLSAGAGLTKLTAAEKERIGTRIRCGPLATFPRIHKDLQLITMKDNEDLRYNGSILNIWAPLDSVEENQYPIGFIPSEQKALQFPLRDIKHAREKYLFDDSVFEAETLATNRHCVGNLFRRGFHYFPSMRPGDALVWISSEIWHVALTHLSCDGGNHSVCDCERKCTRKSLDLRVFVH